MFPRNVKIIIAIILIASFVLPYFNNVAQAQIGGFISCAAGGFLNSLIDRGIKWLQGLVKDWASRIPGVGGLIGSVLGGGGDAEVPVNESRIRSKEFAADITARCLAREILASINDSIADIIRNGGRDGGASFVRNWRNFQTQSQYRGENIFRAILASTDLCPHISQGVRTLFNANQAIQLPGQNTRAGNLDSFQLRANCSLPSTFDLNQYRQNPGQNGGWQAFTLLSQPQNNFYGMLFMALDEIDTQRGLEQSGDIYETLGHGFTGRRGDSPASACIVRGVNGQCLAYRDILTPGSYLSSNIEAAAKSEMDWVLNSDELSELIATGVRVLINRARNLSDPNDGDYEVAASEPVPSIGVTPLPIPTDPAVPPGGGAGQCDIVPGLPQQYGSRVQNALAAYANNPANASVVNSPNNDLAAIDTFLRGVAAEINSGGVNGSRVLNGNMNLSPDSVAIWANGDALIEYYDVIVNQGDGTPIINGISGAPRFVGHTNLSCSVN